MASRTAARRILVVDDDPRVRHAVRHLIDGMPGLHVAAVASNADEAEAACRTSVPDLAIVDVRVPDRESGLKLIRSLSTRMPVIAISVTGSLARPATRAGATAFCDKDGNTDALINAVLAALGNDPPAGQPSNQQPSPLRSLRTAAKRTR
jgi:DNA-binding NarL/FixJ family response regulator